MREGQPRPSYYRTREDSDEVELPQDIASSLSAAQAWLHTHPSPWVRSWEYSDDTTPAAADGEGGGGVFGARAHLVPPRAGSAPSRRHDGMNGMSPATPLILITLWCSAGECMLLGVK